MATTIEEISAEAAIRRELTNFIEKALFDRELREPAKLAQVLHVFPSGAEVLLDQLDQRSSSVETLFRIADALGITVTLQAHHGER